MTKLWRKPSTSTGPITHDPDWWLLAILITLVMFGLVMVYSATFGLAQQNEESPLSYLIKQGMYVCVGLVGLLVATRIDYHRYRRWALHGMIAATALLAALVFVPGLGTDVFGAKRWIFIGPFSLQPSEIAKLALVIYLASWLSGKGQRVRSFSYGTLQVAVVLGMTVGLVMMEPDLGTSILIGTVGLAMFFVAGANLVQFGASIFVGASLFLTMALSSAYRRERLLVFLDPDADARNLGWQVFQAKLALGSGGLFGLGLGASRQKFTWLPAPHNDAIFAIIGEELGLAGCFFLLMLFCALAIRGYRVARRAPDAFGALIAVGITTWLIFQALFNIGGIVSAMPLTGIPMPFISAGGSSLIVSMTAVGILLNISRQTIEQRVAHPVEQATEADTEPLPTPVRAPQGVKTFGRASRMGSQQ